ncbi:transglutaminase-like domain-containing protein [Marinilongibacter aquaticus]|uniref:transglutaminase-like domain-containing protein n=1 Tax=Marinilongibacter aquaticus TaxID=2975157 RepID=UPI0021BDDEB1|nr:transglutaminase-like domain-containing protein [Marinilongibacter aquaticus]UBM58451.1 transglutaminase-like domain-containing protein [Marinilongibacter aquaticus]
MKESEIKALVSLLDDSDNEVSNHVEKQIKNLGGEAIPFLEMHWQDNPLNQPLQKRLEDLIHELQYSQVSKGMIDWKNNRQHDLLEGMWLIAKYQYPDLELQSLKKELNQIYFDAWLHLRDEIHPFDAVKTLNHVFFKLHKFAANTKNFHSPANSLINQVIETKRGNPISLCVIYMLIAQRLGFPIFGVNLPSLFILTYKSNQIQFYINIFNKGLIFEKKDIDSYLKQMQIDQKDMFYEPCNNLEIIRRSLLNLMYSFQKNAETEKMEEVKKIFDSLYDQPLD